MLISGFLKYFLIFWQGSVGSFLIVFLVLGVCFSLFWGLFVVFLVVFVGGVVGWLGIWAIITFLVFFSASCFLVTNVVVSASRLFLKIE